MHKLKIHQLPRTGKPYKLDKLPPEIEYTLDGMVYKLKIIYVRQGIMEAHKFICQNCGRTCTTLYFTDKALCNKCAPRRKEPNTINALYCKLQEYIDHNRTMEFIGRKKFNKRIKDLSARIARLEAANHSKL
jgi:hypothetical protein